MFAFSLAWLFIQKTFYSHFRSCFLTPCYELSPLRCKALCGVLEAYCNNDNDDGM